MNKSTDIKAVMGKNIASARKKLGYSQEKFAELTSISLSTLSKIETGSNMPKPATLKKIILNLGLDLHELFINDDVVPKKDIYSKLQELLEQNKNDSYFNEALYQYALLLLNCKKNKKI